MSAKDLELSLVSADGRVVQRQKVPQGVGHSEQSEGTTFSFPLSAFSPGLYHVHLSDNTRWISGVKLVVE